MRTFVGVLLLAHAVAHLVGFVVPWRLVVSPEMPYRTTVLGGALDVGPTGARALGLAWLATAVAFTISGIGLLTGYPWWRPLGLVTAVVSLVVSALGWPESRIGILVNLAFLVLLALAPGFGPSFTSHR